LTEEGDIKTSILDRFIDGSALLSTAFWKFFVIGKLIILGAPMLYVQQLDRHPGPILAMLIPMCFLGSFVHDFLSTLAIWRCSSNTEKYAYGVFARVVVLAWLCGYIVLAVYIVNITS